MITEDEKEQENRKNDSDKRHNITDSTITKIDVIEYLKKVFAYL